jgi:putative membrane protein (TIGR04086 family)
MGNRLLLRPVISGLVAIVSILFLASLILTLILHFTSVKEASVEWFLLPITLLTLFIGGGIAGYRSGSRGWYFGGLTGLSFLVFAWLISFLGFNSVFTYTNLMLYFSYLLLAIVGGVVGVNMSPRRNG